MEELQKQYEKGEISVSDFRIEYSLLSKQVENFERTLSNKTNLTKLNQSLATSISKIGELNETFEQTEDEATKVELVAKMVEDFGI
jgi:hypothetical protein